MLSVFFIQLIPISGIEVIVFNQKKYYPTEDANSLKPNLKRSLIPDRFLQCFWSLKIANLAIFWTKLCALWRFFFQNAESVTRIIYAWQIIPNNKMVPNWSEASYSVVLISYYLCFHTRSSILSKIYSFPICSITKNYARPISVQSEHSGLSPDILRVVFRKFRRVLCIDWCQQHGIFLGFSSDLVYGT